MRLVFIFFIFFLLKINFAQGFQYEQVFIPNINNKIEIIFDKQNYRKYFNHLSNISLRNKVLIEDKKWFNISIKYNDKIIKARARIASYNLDHIDFRRGFSSLHIKLKDGHIGHITNFRLLKPRAKGFEHEVFWSALFETLGYPTPYTKLTDVIINNEKYLMIFQEKAEKEFLERWSVRETPIISGAYRQFESLLGTCVLKGIKESMCWDKFLPSVYYSNKIENQNYIKDLNSAIISYKAILSNNIYQFQKFYDLNKDYASHGLNKKNSKFFFDPIYNLKHFTYYDGDINFKNFNKKNCLKKEILQNEFNKNRYFFLEKIYLERSNLKLNEIQNCISYLYLSNKNNYFYKIPFEKIKISNKFSAIDSPDFDSFESPIKKIDDNILNFNPNFITYSNQNNKFLYCENFVNENKNISCKELDSLKKIKDGLSISKPSKKFKDYDIYDLVLLPDDNSYEFDKVKKSKQIINNPNEKIIIDKNSTIFLKIGNNVKELDVILEDSNSSRLVVHGLIPPDIKISVRSNPLRSQKVERMDQNSLTGCITFLDSYIKNIDIFIKDAQCEDAVNFIRSKGKINKIEIYNSKSDAIDMDFSDLNIDSIKIDRAGNDCVDVSFGKYIFKKIDLNKCGDKGVSVGEISNVKIIYSSISNSQTAIATKDSSVSKINEIRSINNKVCIENYNKKKEFNGGITYLNNDISNECKDNIKIDKYSKIIFN